MVRDKNSKNKNRESSIPRVAFGASSTPISSSLIRNTSLIQSSVSQSQLPNSIQATQLNTSASANANASENESANANPNALRSDSSEEETIETIRSSTKISNATVRENFTIKSIKISIINFDQCLFDFRNYFFWIFYCFKSPFNNER